MLVLLTFDQFCISVIALLTTAMISSSSQESVSAVSLVSPLYHLDAMVMLPGCDKIVPGMIILVSRRF